MSGIQGVSGSSGASSISSKSSRSSGHRQLQHMGSSAEWRLGGGSLSGSTVESGLALFAGKKVLLVEVCDMVGVAIFSTPTSAIMIVLVVGDGCDITITIAVTTIVCNHDDNNSNNNP